MDALAATQDPENGLARRVARFLLRHRVLLLSLALLSAAPAAVRTALTYAHLRSELEELLPSNAPSVRALEAARARLPGLRTLGVVVDTGGPRNLPAAARFLDELAARLRALPPELVSGVSVGVSEERAFAETFALQLMDPADVRKLREAVEARRDWQIARSIGADLLDAKEDPPPAVPLDELRQKYEQRFGTTHHYPGDRFVAADGRTAVLLARTGSHATGYAADADLLERVQREVADLGFPERYAWDMRLGYAGDVPTRVEEMEGLLNDLGWSGALVSGLVIAVLLAYFRSVRSLFVLGIPLAIGVVYSFALVALPPFSIRSLNSSTAFLGSIIVGNGINSGIMLLARFREERLNGASLDHAAEIALERTWLPTLAAAGAAAAAYGSLVFSDFRGFRQFGWIGGLGILICWATAMLLIPPLCRLFGERATVARPSMPVDSTGGGGRPSGGPLDARRRVDALLEHPRALLLISAVLVGVSIWGLARRGGDWIEYDLSALRRRDSWTHGERFWGARMDATTGRSLTPTVVLAHDAEQARAIGERLRGLRAQGRAGGLIATVRSSADLFPPSRAEALAEARRIAELMTPRLRATLEPRERAIVERALSPRALAPLTAADVPETLAAGLRERNGRMDRSVLIFPNPGRLTWDAARLEGFAADVRQAASLGGQSASVTGSLLLSSDLAAAMTRDGPRATLLSFVAVLVVCATTFGTAWLSLAAMASLLAGVSLMLGAMAWGGQRLNFSNFVALPITFGIGADYSINVLKRFQQQGSAQLGQALSATGGAVALCSATTIIGYSSLLVAQNQALFSFGVFAVTGELACLATAVLSLPGALAVLGGRSRTQGGA